MKKKRIGLFVFFNFDGYVEDYVDYLLKEINKSLDNLYIMVIGKLLPEGKKVLNKYSKNIAYKENKGFTGEAWRKQIIEQVGFEELSKYDEALFFNDIFYGPVYPFKKILEKMDKKKDLDFWGITRHYDVKDFTECHSDGIIHEHIQTYFYAVRNKMLCSDDFSEFWTNMPEIKTAQDDVGNQETAFTEYFENRGYKWDTYVDMDSLKGEGLNNYCMNYEIPYTLLKEYDMPFIRRKSLIQVIENSVSGPENEANRVLDYIKNNTNYDIDLIWNDLLRNNNLYDLYTKLHLDYILDNNKSLGTINGKKIGVFVDDKDIDKCRKYTKNIDKYYDVYYLSEIKDINKYIKKYDYVCYINDEVNLNEGILYNKSYRDLLFDNTINNKTYINNIIYTFENNERLGYLGIPNMIGSLYWDRLTKKWLDNDFEDINNILDSLNIKVKLSIDTSNISLGNAFWFKVDTIKDILKDNILDIKKALPYIIQNKGYYSGIVYSREYASIYLPALLEEYRRYAKSHPYTAGDTSKSLTTYPLSVLIKAIMKKVYYKIKGR